MRRVWVALLVVVALVAAGIVANNVLLKSGKVAAPAIGISLAEQGGAPNLAEDQKACSSQPVNCVSGELWERFTDFSIPGLGESLELSRTYVSADASTRSAFGYGWSSNYGMSLTPPDAAGVVTVRQEDGAVVSFHERRKHRFTASPWVMATLKRNLDGSYTFVRDSDQVSFVFSRTGQLITESDLDGDTTTLTYAGSRLVKVTDPSGRELLFGYTGPYISSVTAPMGAVERLAYQAGNLVQVTDPVGRVWSFGYSGHLLISVTDPLGRATAIKYGADHRVRQVRGPGEASTTWRYSGNPVSSGGGTTKVTATGGQVAIYRYSDLQLTSVTAAAGRPGASTTRYTHNQQTLVTSVTDPDGHSTTFTYDRAGNLLTATDPLGRMTRYAYNRYGEIVSRALPSGATSRDWYDANGNLIMTRDALGNVTTYSPDQNYPSLVAKVTAPGGRVTSFGYDAFGDMTSVTTSPRPGTTDTTRYTFDAAGKVTCEVSPDAVARHITCPAAPPICPVAPGKHRLGTTSYGLNCDGQVTTTIDPSGNVTRDRYSPDGNLTTVTAPPNNVTSYTYNSFGQPTAVTKNGIVISTTTYYDTGVVKTQSSAPGHVTSYTYDRLGRVMTMTNPLGQTTRYSYDPAGNLIETTNPSGQVTSYTYDAAGEVSSVVFGVDAVPAISYTYTADGQPYQVADAVGTTTYAYDADQRLHSQTQATPSGASTGYSYSYNDAGNTVTLTYPNGQKVTDRYNTAGQLAAVSDWLGNVINFHYDASGNLTAEDAPGVRVAYGPVSITIAHNKKDLAVFAYTRNQVGLIEEAGSAGLPGSTGKVADYSYTKRGELAAGGGLSFGYDSAGNLTSSSSGFSQIFNAGDELTSRDSSFTGPTDYGYDPEGDLASVLTPGGPTTHLAYNQANWLTGIASPSLNASYSYSGAGLLTSATVDGSQTSFTWDQSQSTPLLLATTQGAPTASTPSRTASPSASASPATSSSPSGPEPASTSYIYGPRGQPIEQIAGSSPTFLLADEQGSIRVLTNAFGHEVGAISYGPYGNVTGRTGKVTTAMGYDGQYTDLRTGYIYLRARYYNPDTGQFLTPDPDVSATGEPYSYAGNDPINASDPLGLSWWNPFSWSAKTWAAIGIGAVLAVGAILTDGADLALAPEVLGLGAADAAVADAAGVATADALGAAADEGLANLAGEAAADSAGAAQSGGDVVLSGHGSYDPANGYVTVPDGTSVVTYTPHDDVLANDVANEIELGNFPAPYKVYNSGDLIPNYTLHPIPDLPVAGNPVLVDQPTLLSELLQPGMGTVHWAACTTAVRVC